MAKIERSLVDPQQVGMFLDETIDIDSLLDDGKILDDLREHFKNPEMSKDDCINGIIQEIADIEKEEAKIDDNNNTFANQELRVVKWKTKCDRRKLHETIIESCVIEPIMEDESKISLYKGGMNPDTEIKRESKLFIIIGGPASGKSKYANAIAKMNGAYLLDSDIIKRKIPEFESSQSGASLVHKESKDILKLILEFVSADGSNIVLPIVGKDYAGLRDQIEEFEKTRKYTVSLVLIKINRLEAVKRAFLRFIQKGRYVPLSYVLDTCGHEPIAAFYRIAAEDRERQMCAIDNKEKNGKVEFCQQAETLTENLIEDSGVEKLSVKE